MNQRPVGVAKSLQEAGGAAHRDLRRADVQGVSANDIVRTAGVGAVFSRVLAAAILLTAALVFGAGPAAAQTPSSFADLAEKLMPSVVNIATTQQVQGRNRDLPQAPPGSPLEEFFKEFFERGRPGTPGARRATS